jgi:hypothetical protein
MDKESRVKTVTVEDVFATMRDYRIELKEMYISRKGQEALARHTERCRLRNRRKRASRKLRGVQ